MRATKHDNYWVQLEFKDVAERELFSKGVSYKIPGGEYSSAFKSGVWDAKKSFLTPANKIAAGLFKHIYPTNKIVYNAPQNLGDQDIPLLRNNPTLEVRGYQLVAINKIFEHKRLIINAIMGSGKCLGIDTPLIMSDGKIKAVQDVIVGDKLLGPDGKGRNVLSTTSGRDKLYKITPIKGDPYIVNSVHLLSLVKTPGSPNIYLSDGTMIPKDEYRVFFIEAETFFNSPKAQLYLKGWRPESVDFEHEIENHKIPPYILGLWLGDGSSCTPQISSTSEEIVTEFDSYAKSIDCRLRNMALNHPEKCPIYNLSRDTAKANGFTDGLKYYSLLGNKHIPKEYLLSSKQNRLELLAGLLDTDGCLDSGNCYEITQKNKFLAEDIVFLARSLGLAAYTKECIKTIKSIEFSGTYWRIHISGDCSIVPVRLAYKKARPRKQKKNVLRTGLKIEFVGRGKYYGFEIDGDRQFLLKDWQVTHNTLIAAAAISYHLKLNPRNKALFVCYDKNILDQTYKKFIQYGLKDVSKYGDGVKDLSGRIVIATIQSLSRIKLPKKILKDITFVFVDEAHHSKARTTKQVLTKLSSCEHYVGLTATVFKPKSLELAELMAITGPVLFEYGFKEALENNAVVPVKCFFVKAPEDLNVKAEIFHRKNYQAIWEGAVKNNVARHEYIKTIVSTLVELLDTTQIVMVDRIDHGFELAQCLAKDSKIKVDTMYGLHSIVQRDMKKEALGSDSLNTTNCLISTTVTEGVDFAISPVLAINASGRKSFIRVIQFLGRLTRQNDKFGRARAFVDLLDGFYHPQLKKHSEERIQACRDAGCEVEVFNNLQDLLLGLIKHFKDNK